ncbi:zinc ribbon domain-containing protein [Ligilactobacillus agilis]|uniref:zinc ribbon domain-containing protein n=2 Tax=Ligilactobacillus agilis TaxID=1601 RepID=UPI00195CD246|nr:zinc ribbon domain-containing protein [Ligilactobacillus agilis]MBM6773031.1 zinc ribbon domain-containing protein [Ligilactobacillus agilis]
MADNWYVILELEFDPPVEDEQKISDRIDEKAKFWSTHFNDFKMGAQYRAWHQNIPQIKKDMIGATNIRKQLAADACTIVYNPVDKLLKTIGRKGNITADEGDKLSKKLKISIDVVKKRAAKLGIKWDASGVSKDYQATYDKYYKTKPQNASSFDGMKQMLSSFNVDNLYDFLYINTTVKNANRLPCETLRQRAAEKKKTEFYKNDSISGTGSKLCGQCELAFKDESSKDVYDKYLEYTKRKAILDDAKSIADISGELSAEQADEFIGQLTQIFRDRKLSEEVLTAFCKIEKIFYNASGAETNNANIKVCRCGYINDISDGRKVCSNCGLELEIKCPKCGTTNDANIKVCKCGFKFENIDRALALCEQAEHAIDALDFTVAKAHLSDAARYWPNSSKVQALKDRLAEFEQRVGKEVEKMRGAIKEKRYCEARSQYTNIQKLFSGYSDTTIEQEISQAITKAQSLFNQAKAAKVEKDILELCAQAYDFCTDLPGVKELMPAPSAITGMSVSTNGSMKTNIVSWNSTNDRSIRYIVVRSTNGWIQHIADGETVFRGSANSYSDKAIEPGITYYYNVFAERAGVFSQGAKGESVVNLFEISNVSITAADASLNIMWDSLPANATAEIYEVAANGNKKLIATSSSDCYLVSGLINGATYSYQVCLAYIVNGKKEVTKGVVKSGVPDCPPEPIDTLRVKPSQDDNFEAIWYQDGSNDVRLFCSTQKPKYNLGDIVSLSNLEQEMRPLQQRPLSSQANQSLKPNEKGASFQYNGTELLYIVAVVVKSGSAVFGSLARASKGETVNIKDIRPVNGQINIYIDAPTTATGFVVLYRFDQFPSDIGDVKTIRKYIPLKQYQLNSAIVLDTLEPKKYYFSVFAEFKRDGEKDYSAGSDYLFDNSPRENITYSISVNKKLFGDRSVVLEFEAENREFELPAIDVMSAIGNTPMFKETATHFFSIPAQHVNGTLTVKIPLTKSLPKNTYIKAFLKEESATDVLLSGIKPQPKIQLRLKLKSNYKIS